MVEVAFSGLALASITIEHQRHRLKNIKGQAERSDEVQDGPMQTHAQPRTDCLSGAKEKPGVLEDTQHSEVQRQRQHKQQLSSHTAGQYGHRSWRYEIDCRNQAQQRYEWSRR